MNDTLTARIAHLREISLDVPNYVVDGVTGPDATLNDKFNEAVRRWTEREDTEMVEQAITFVENKWYEKPEGIWQPCPRGCERESCLDMGHQGFYVR